MSTYSNFETDPELERKGIDLDMGSSGKFILARAGGANDGFRKRLEGLTKPHRRQIQTGTIDDEVSDQIWRQIYAEKVLLGWEGVTGRDGEPLPFTVENAIQLFIDLPDLFATIRQVADDASLYRKVVQEQDSKN